MLNRTMNLGELIAALERKGKDEIVRYDFGHFRPDGLRSWRGDYSHLALGYTEDSPDEMKVEGLVALLRDADGKEFTGWKGGEYTMSETTPVWVANRGECPDTGIVDVIDGSIGVVLATAHVEY